MVDERRYALAPLDRNGVLLGLGWSEVVIVAIGGVMTSFVLMNGAPFFAGALPLLAAAAFVKVKFRGLGLIEWVRPVLRLVTQRNKVVWSTSEPWKGNSGESPSVLAGLVVSSEHMPGQKEWAVVWDKARDEATSMLRVSGSDFALLAADQQAILLDGWGNVLSTHATEGSPVTRVCWTELANRTSLRHHLDWVADQGSDVDAKHRQNYVKLVSSVGTETTRHDVVVSVTVSGRKLRSSKWGQSGKSERDRLLDALQRALHQTSRTLEAAELAVSGVLSPEDVRELVRSCVDPTSAQEIAPRVGSMAERLGLVGSDRMGPRETTWEAAYFETDRCFHRSYLVADWPRWSVPGDWMTHLLARPETSRRMTLIFEPTSPSVSHRRIERELVKLDGDANMRAEKGRRITAGLRRSQVAVHEREEELVSGFAETKFAGLVTISAPSLEELGLSTDEFESAALASGLTLRPLDFQHDLGWAASMPLGLGLASEGVWE